MFSRIQTRLNALSAYPAASPCRGRRSNHAVDCRRYWRPWPAGGAGSVCRLRLQPRLQHREQPVPQAGWLEYGHFRDECLRDVHQQFGFGARESPSGSRHRCRSGSSAWVPFFGGDPAGAGGRSAGGPL